MHAPLPFLSRAVQLCRAFFVAWTFAVLSAAAYSAEPLAWDKAHDPWPASWIADENASPTGYGVYHFRKAFELPKVPQTFPIHVSADNRYRLFVNGVSVATGPARGDLMHWRYDTLDIAPHLRPGRNVLAVLVWNGGFERPENQQSLRTALLIQGGTPELERVNSNETWRVFVNPAYSPEPLGPWSEDTYIVVADGERIDGRKYPWGWENPDFDDSGWPTAEEVAEPLSYGVGTVVQWWLVPRNIPLMEETPQRLARVRRSAGVQVPAGFLEGRAPLRVPANTKATLLLDQSFETNAFPVLRVSGGAGSQIRLTYAEALVDSAGQKGHRDEIEGRACIGKSDVFIPDGATGRVFSTLAFRTYRYVEMDIQTGDQPVTIDDLSGVFTGYPFREQGRFESDDARLPKIWEVAWRTARLCAYETYFDCPYYEQLQYLGDTRIQSLISLYVAGDDRLMRNAIEAFDQSRVAEGLTRSRYPDIRPQLIPTFSLFWINTVHDYWMHREDPAFVEERLLGVRNVLHWFERKIDAKTGMIGPMPDWTFVDWADEWERPGHIGGEPTGVHQGGSAPVTFQLAMTLRDAADLCEAFGDTSLAARYRSRASQLNERAIALCWDSSRQLLADTPAKKEFSQQTNIFAVLAGAFDAKAAREVMQRVIADKSLIQATPYFRFYFAKAIKRAGLGDHYLESLGPWHDMLARGLTTFAERQDPARSDCHAWSASPLYDFLATVCGIEPGSPGFRTVRVQPHLGKLNRASGSVPTGRGDVTVRYMRTGSRIEAEISLPDGMTGEFIWAGRTYKLKAGTQKLTAE